MIEKGDKAVFVLLLLLYLTRASKRFHANLKLLKRAYSRSVTVSTLMSIVNPIILNPTKSQPLCFNACRSLNTSQIYATKRSFEFHGNLLPVKQFSSSLADHLSKYSCARDDQRFRCSTLNWHEDFEINDNFHLNKRADHSLVFDLIAKSFPESKHCFKLALLSGFVVDTPTWAQTLQQRSPEVREILGVLEEKTLHRDIKAGKRVQVKKWLRPHVYISKPNKARFKRERAAQSKILNKCLDLIE